MNKVVCMGEAIADFIPRDGRHIPTAGGAPSNVCACVSKLGGRGCYMGKLAKDAYGFFLLQNMKDCGIDTSLSVSDGRFKTPLSFVTLTGGEREFEFLRDDTADLNFSPDDVKENVFQPLDVLHFCSVCLMESPTKRAHGKAISLAVKNGAYVSFDVNLRPALWESSELMAEAVIEFLPYADIVKLSEEELEFLCDYLKADKSRREKTIFDIAKRCKILLITKGAKGACAYDRNLETVGHSALNKNPVDTTGAGDCFIGSILYLLAEKKIELKIENMPFALEFASKACAIEVSRYGGMNAMPKLREIENF